MYSTNVRHLQLLVRCKKKHAVACKSDAEESDGDPSAWLSWGCQSFFLVSSGFKPEKSFNSVTTIPGNSLETTNSHDRGWLFLNQKYLRQLLDMVLEDLRCPQVIKNPWLLANHLCSVLFFNKQCFSRNHQKVYHIVYPVVNSQMFFLLTSRFVPSLPTALWDSRALRGYIPVPQHRARSRSLEWSWPGKRQGPKELRRFSIQMFIYNCQYDLFVESADFWFGAEPKLNCRPRKPVVSELGDI